MNTKKRIQFLRKTLNSAKKDKLVVGVSGGIDSIVTLKLCSMAVGIENTIAGVLPYNLQNIQDSAAAVQWVGIKPENTIIRDIGGTVDSFGIYDEKRKGNVMARARMIYLFDFAKALNGLVVGTENKTERELGYFTRYGDAASDIEVINDLYKTEVRELARELKVPEYFITKAPSAGLWTGQTDEGEFGFTYEQADAVLKGETIVDKKIADEVLLRKEGNAFKHKVPYVFAE